ncbi:MAG: pseudaminic acid cytidylyltransferase [Cyanobacteria bacterium P01_B01_bin.77]
MRVAIIPARGGSKRIPRKNIRSFYGKPMIAWSIVAALESHLFDHVIVSTDDAEIVKVSKQWGAEVPFIRPDNLADDHTGTTEVVTHATQWAIEQGWPITSVCCIYATAPFIQVDDLQRGCEILDTGNWDYAFSVTEFTAPIFRALSKTPEGGVEMFFPQYLLTRSQDLPRALHDAGQFYWGRPSVWLDGKHIFQGHSTPVIIPRWRVQDIDHEEDWTRAEIMAPVIMNKIKSNS